MPYLNLDTGYFEHIKIKRLVARLGQGSESIPLKLWAYCANHYPDTGEIPNHSPEEIASLIGYLGDAQAMLQALLDLELAVLTPKGAYAIHEWSEHQGHIISFHLRAKAGAKARWDKHNPKSNDATSIAKIQTSIATSYAPNLPNLPTKPNNRLSDEAFISKLKTLPAYNHIDIDLQLSKIDAWLLSNPKRQKTRRFIINWLNRIEQPMEICQPKRRML